MTASHSAETPTASPADGGRRPSRLPTIRDLRLVSGLVLFSYVACHLIGLAGGLFLIDGMRAVSSVTLAVWQTPPGEAALYGAFLLHAALGLMSVAGRRFWMAPLRRRLQGILGLLVPLALLPHLAIVLIGPSLLGSDDGLARVLAHYAVGDPLAYGLQVALVALVWTHGCLGIRDWLRFRPVWRRIRPAFATIALLVPTLALLGFTNAGLEAEVAELASGVAGPGDVAVRDLTRILVGGWLAALATAVSVAAARRVMARLKPGFVVRAAGHPPIAAERGETLLSALRGAGIAPPSLCGGRARCSTCRVQILPGSAPQPPPADLEAATLARIRAPGGVRLACQLKPVGEIVVVPVLSARGAGALPAAAPLIATREETVVVAAFDLRNSTALLEGRLPYDVFHILGAWQEIVRRRVGDSGGHVVSIAGDGLMTVFPVERAPEETGRTAFKTALDVQADLAALSAALQRDLGRPLEAGVGIHIGSGLIGQEVDGPQLQFFGEPANVASRLHHATKRFGGAVVASEATIIACRLPEPHRSATLALHDDGEPIAVGIYEAHPPL
jgi:adenylate cyclase